MDRGDFAVDIAENILGYEDYMPPKYLIHRIWAALPPGKHRDRGEILQCLLNWRLSEESIHIPKIISLLIGISPTKLTSGEESELREKTKEMVGNDFSVWLFVDDWLVTKGLKS